MKARFTYEYTRLYGRPHHRWIGVCAHGAIHVHITEGRDGRDAYGGIEIHYAKPPGYRCDDAPDHENCRYSGGRCWTDGSSLAASEYWIPKWKSDPHDHEEMFRRIERELREYFIEVSEESVA